tara:strand:+ start:811 stop:1065 length:255 start_codon:yes stop_codon:yes gene_type:complete
MDYLELIKFKESQFENLKTNVDKSIVWGKLKALEDLSLYIDQMRESLSRLLVVNGIEDDEDFDKKVLNPKIESPCPPSPRRASP